MVEPNPNIINMKKLLNSKKYHAKYRTYFFNLYEQDNGNKVLEVIESKVLGPNKYKRIKIRIFGEDIQAFLKNLDEFLDNEDELK